MDKRILQRVASLQLQGKNSHEEAMLKILVGDPKTIVEWSKPLSNQERLDRNNAIFDHWLAGETITQLAKSGNIGHSQVANIIKHSIIAKRDLTGITEAPPIYNVWNYALCDPRFGQKHPGQIPGQSIINLLLWLTKPFDVVVDPMAGGGTTIDVCRYLLRRYFCYDIDPKRQEIKQWDIQNGYPPMPYKPDFILLDPPYWRMKREGYASDSASMLSYQEWLEFMNKLARDSFKALKPNGYLALFIQSFIDEWETGKFILANHDCVTLFRRIPFEPIMEIALNMPSQIKNFRDVTWAKRNKKLLGLKRDIFVFRKN